jgi:predicted NAD/FAD-binding protein
MARIAIIGAGVSGLTAALALDAAGHDVEVLEAGDRPGGHSCTVDASLPGGPQPVDMGFIVLNDRNYPHFEAMLGHLGVATTPSDMSFSVTDGGAFEYASTSLSGLYANRRHALSPAFGRMLLDVRRFQREAPALLELPGAGPSLRAYLDDNAYSRWFVERLLVPQAAAVWSADPEQMWSFPAKFLVRFFANHGMLSLTDRPRWRYVRGGSRTYVEALLRRLRGRVRLGTPVATIARVGDHVTVVPRGGHPEVFDEVVLATHSDQALALLADPSDAERAVLGAIPYQPNEAVLHTDRALLPRRERAWASWNYHLVDEPRDRATMTYLMNRLQGIDSPEPLCVTLNHTAGVDPEKILHVERFAHPVFTPEGMRAQERHAEISGVRRTHYAGAYWRWGFHEDGVWSALRACAALGVAPPWEAGVAVAPPARAEEAA